MNKSQRVTPFWHNDTRSRVTVTFGARRTVKEFLDTSRALTQAAHEALGGAPGTRPLVVDPFAGGGSIPLEALRVGADAFASDLNPVPVLLNKVILEYIPKHGQRLADEVLKWGEWVKQEAEKELAELYPKDHNGATPIAYLWARTITCEGPGCGAEVPLIRSLWLAKKANRSVALRLVPRPRAKRVDLQIIHKERGGWVDQDDPKSKIQDPKFDGTVKRASATCPCCGYTTRAERVREQLRNRAGGTSDARMTVVVRDDPSKGTQYHLPSKVDLEAAARASRSLARHRAASQLNGHPFAPDEPTPTNESHRSVGSLWIYGMRQWRDVYTVHSSAAPDLATLVLNHLRQTDDLVTGVSPSFLVKHWPPAFTEWATKSVRDAFFASPQFPRILSADAIRDTITRGVANGLLAYVGKNAKGEYKPFCFNQALMTTDIDFSEEMLLITKETAEAYLKSKATPGTPAPEPKPGEPSRKPEPLPQEPDGKKPGEPKKPEQLMFASMAWTGDVPPQKWMKFYTAVLSKFAAAKGLKLKLTVEVAPEGGISKQKIEETKAALRELGLPDDINSQ
jgi:hypothetical protein